MGPKTDYENCCLLCVDPEYIPFDIWRTRQKFKRGRSLLKVQYYQSNSFWFKAVCKRAKQELWRNTWVIPLSLQYGSVNVGRDRVVSVEVCYWRDGPGIESQRGRDFSYPSGTILVPTQPPVRWVPSFFPRVKAAIAWRLPPTPSKADVKETVDLYFYSPSRPSWAVIGRNFIHVLILTKPTAPYELIRGYDDTVGLYLSLRSRCLYSAVPCPKRSPANSVRTVTTLRARPRGIVFEFREVGEGLSRLKASRPTMSPPSFLNSQYRGLFPGDKAAGAWSWPLSAFIAKINNTRKYTSNRPTPSRLGA
jgi:hypothetical protein